MMLRLTGGLELDRYVREGRVRTFEGDAVHAQEVIAALADSIHPLRDRGPEYAALAARLPVDAALMRGTREQLALAFPGWREQLPTPRARTVMNPFTKKPTVILDRDPGPDEPPSFRPVAPPMPFVGLPQFCPQDWASEVLTFASAVLGDDDPPADEDAIDPFVTVEERFPRALFGPASVDVLALPETFAERLCDLDDDDWLGIATRTWHVYGPLLPMFLKHVVAVGRAARDLAGQARRDGQRVWLWSRA